MHILGLILAIVAGGAFWWWRMKAVGEAANDAADVAGRVWGKYKRKKFLNKVNDSPLAVIDDPATAAVILMHAIQKEDGLLGPLADAALRREVEETMKISDSEEIITFGKWTANQATDANTVIQRFGDIWKQHLNVKERADLVEMAERISSNNAQTDLSAIQKTRLARLRQRMGLPI